MALLLLLKLRKSLLPGAHNNLRFESEEGKRDSIIVVAQLSPEFTARLVDRWKELEEERSRPKSQAELIAEMAC